MVRHDIGVIFYLPLSLFLSHPSYPSNPYHALRRLASCYTPLTQCHAHIGFTQSHISVKAKSLGCTLSQGQIPYLDNQYHIVKKVRVMAPWIHMVHYLCISCLPFENKKNVSQYHKLTFQYFPIIHSIINQFINISIIIRIFLITLRVHTLQVIQ